MPKFRVYLSGKADIGATLTIEAENLGEATKMVEKEVMGQNVADIDWEIDGIDPFDVDIDAIREL